MEVNKVMNLSPRQGEDWVAVRQVAGPDCDLYGVVSLQRPIAGQLTVRLRDGRPDGWDWAGSPITDEDRDDILDLFEGVY